MNIITKTFLFNLICIIIFAIIYSTVPKDNFMPLNKNDKLTFVDFLFYSLTIQSGIGLPDVTALSDLAKILAMIQQFMLLGSAYILFIAFYNR